MTTELAKDIAELESLRKGGKIVTLNRQTILDETINSWRLKLDDLKAKSKDHLDSKQAQGNASTVSVSANSNMLRPMKKLTTYAYDESDKFVKLYYTISGIQNVAPDHIVSKIEENSFEVTCKDIDGTDYSICVKGFLHPVDASKSVVKAKADSLLIMLKKKKENEQWKSLLKLQQSKEVKTPKFDDKGDPSDSLMGMMKNMYDDGDDEMKRTIRKAWHESQSKKGDLAPDF